MVVYKGKKINCQIAKKITICLLVAGYLVSNFKSRSDSEEIGGM